MGSTYYTIKHRIRFSECDPAGIVFYPQYFVMFNDCIEKWMDSMIDDGYNGIIAKHKVGMPTVNIQANFHSISKMGDDVELKIGVRKIGSRSFQLHWQCVGIDNVLRMEVEQTIVTTSLVTHKAIEIPEFMRTAIEKYLLSEAKTA